MDSSTKDTGPLTIIVTWHIRKEQEREFEAWHREVTAVALTFPGHMGVNVIRASGARQEFVVIFRFDTYEHLRSWQESEIHRTLMKKAEPLRKKEPTYRLETGLEFWFTPHTHASPPRWKMALVTILGVWPTSLLISWLFGTFDVPLPVALKGFLTACGIVVLLTWMIMPLLIKIFKRWL